jgi:hypothetical protein
MLMEDVIPSIGEIDPHDVYGMVMEVSTLTSFLYSLEK